MNEVKPVKPWRSPCPVARTLDLIGDRWSLLIVRDMLSGSAKFHQFLASPENIPTNILSGRLKLL
jgi:DNA-binding HxlR family transcriptional regulator